MASPNAAAGASVEAQGELPLGLANSTAPPAAAMTVHVTRSARRRRTMSARLVGSRLEVRVPANLSQAEEARFVERMLVRFAARAAKRELPVPADLLRRARELSARLFDGAL